VALAALAFSAMPMGALAEVQVLSKVFVNKQPNLVHLEVQATASPQKSVIDYKLHAKP
jgi:hypothetical protein